MVAQKAALPADSKMPDRKWRLYVFKDDKDPEIIHIHRK